MRMPTNISPDTAPAAASLAPTASPMIYGMHLTLRIGQVERRQALIGQEHITTLLETLVDRVGMRVLAGPMVAEERGLPHQHGWSGVVILYESHAAIHTYPNQQEAFIDLFSCKDFNPSLVLETLHSFLGSFVVLEQDMHDRGYHWGTNVRDELSTWQGSYGRDDAERVGRQSATVLAEPV